MDGKEQGLSNVIPVLDNFLVLAESSLFAITIMVLELYPFMAAMEMWEKVWRDSSMFSTDNEVVLSVI